MTTEARIRQIFDRVREEPGAVISDPAFMNDLQRGGASAIDNSFKGKRLKNRFLRQVEAEFAIAFPKAVLDQRPSLQEFVATVEDRQKNHAANLQLARKRVQEAKAADFPVLAVLNLFLLGTLLVVAWPVALALAIVLNCALLGFKLRDVRQRKSLVKIMENQSRPAPSRQP
jgi:hypothetical protein